MPFASKRQQRAMFGGHIPGLSKKKAKEWAEETDFLKIPERSPSEKGKSTLRSKKKESQRFSPVRQGWGVARRLPSGKAHVRGALDAVERQTDVNLVDDVHEFYEDDINRLRQRLKERRQAKAKKKNAGLELLVPHFSKLAVMMGGAASPAGIGGMSSADRQPRSRDFIPQSTQSKSDAARGSGNFTPKVRKPTGMAASRIPTNPRLNVTNAMNKYKV